MPTEESPQEEFICDREQCGYQGPLSSGDTAAKVGNTACGLLTCGPWAAIFFGVIFAVLLGLIHEALMWVGFAVGVIIAILVIIGNTSRSSCPACNRGNLESVTSERGQALVRRNKTKFGSER